MVQKIMLENFKYVIAICPYKCGNLYTIHELAVTLVRSQILLPNKITIKKSKVQ